MKLLLLIKRNLALICIVLGVLLLGSGLLVETVTGEAPPQNVTSSATKADAQRQSSTQLQAAPVYRAGRLLLGFGLGLGVLQSIVHLAARRS
jgi:hypothetical protein